ncbi:immunoglobulin-like domain-containing protein [Pseudalkalibacillus sp. SCS-8]|uniref:immunoglobulin-like domain-containing protein n=1 Tax=Pseudalkalibacillus nanhaiensis TaxID=3115291 RepID=UPI0032DB9CBD
MKIKLIVFSVVLLILAGCSSASGSGVSSGGGQDDASNEKSSDTQKLNTEEQVGEQNDKPSINDPLQWTKEDIYEKTGYEPFTGKAFKGLFLHNTYFQADPGEEIGSYEAFPNQKVRVQLVERTMDLEKVKMIEEKILTNGEKLWVKLPEKSGVFYTYSQELLDENNNVLDTDVVVVHVPERELNAKMSIERAQYAPDDTLELTVENFGPTWISFGSGYTIEELKNGKWKEMRLDLVVTSNLYNVRPDEAQTLEINLEYLKLGQGIYRLTKEIQANHTDITYDLSVEFKIE